MPAVRQKRHVFSRKCTQSVQTTWTNNPSGFCSCSLLQIRVRTHLGVVCSELGIYVKLEFPGSGQTINDSGCKVNSVFGRRPSRLGTEPVHWSKYCLLVTDSCDQRRMDAKQEAFAILQNIWTKLQSLPKANSIEIGGFLILLLFVCK